MGLLKQEMRVLGSHVLSAADDHRVPAGGALAVDREGFSAGVTDLLNQAPGIEIVSERVDVLPEARPLLIATGPLTADALAADVAQRVGAEHLAYYDAIAPIVSAESLDWDRVFLASRWDKGASEAERRAYANCPMNAQEYAAFVAALVAGDKVEPRSFERVRYFEGCLPVEVMAERGPRTLAFGPMKPVGLTDPRTGRWPHAVVQLRSEDEARTAYNLVGFQTRLKQAEQRRIFRTIPGLERAEFMRYGAIHRNTFLDAPRLLDSRMALRSDPDVYFAGQITGTEGYVEGAASGWLAAWFIAARLQHRDVLPPPPSTAHGGLLSHLRREGDYQPSNVTFSHLAPWPGERLRKRARYLAMAERALVDLEQWMLQHQLRPSISHDRLMLVPGLDPPSEEAAAPTA